MLEEKEQLEYNVEHYLCEKLNEKGCLTFKFVSPGRKGVPDRIVLTKKGVVYFIETKRPVGGRVSPLQKYWQKMIEIRHGKYALVINKKEVLELIAEMEKNDEI